jgi:hypothetical protein
MSNRHFSTSRSVLTEQSEGQRFSHAIRRPVRCTVILSPAKDLALPFCTMTNSRVFEQEQREKLLSFHQQPSFALNYRANRAFSD